MKLSRRLKKIKVDDLWQWLAFALVISVTVFAFMGSLLAHVFKVKR